MENFTIVIPFFNGEKHIDRLLDSLPEGIPVIVVDDHSDEPLQLDRPENIRIIRPPDKGYFTGAVNSGISSCDTDVLVLNQDTWFDNKKWLGTIKRNRAKYAMFGDGIAGAHPAWPKGYVQGTFMFVRRDAIDRVGLMDATTYPLWGSTCEWQLRICRAGFNARPIASIPGFHHKQREADTSYGSAITEALEESPEQRRRFITTPPIISVIIPCYNYGRYLKDAVNSLIGGKTSLGKRPGQTFGSFEIIIVDDASTDNSAKIAKSLAVPEKGIRFIAHRKNKGTAAALNTGIRGSYGRYITVLSADDMMEPDRLERLYRAARKNPYKVICDNCTVITDGDYVWQKNRKKVFKMRPYDFDEIMYKNTMHCGIFYHIQAWHDAGGYPESFGDGREDWAFNVALGSTGWCGFVLEEYDGYLYRRGHHNRSKKNTSVANHERFLEKLRRAFPKLYSGERNDMCCGKGRVRGNGNNNAAILQQISEESIDGMTQLRYVGQSPVDQTYWGAETGTRYTFGKQKYGFVSNQDVSGFLSLARKFTVA